MDRIISSVIAFLIALVPSIGSQVAISPTPQTTILFTGDIMLGRSVMGASLDNNDPYYPFQKTSEFLKDADITFANLENPIVDNCQRHAGGFKFCTTPEIAKGLTFSGIDVVSLANNHSSNYGNQGIIETKKTLDDLGVKYVGLDNLEVIEKNGIKFGFLGFNYTFTKEDLATDIKLIEESNLKVDVLIVGSHWGEEYKDVANTFQTNAAKQMVEKGADVIIGHHPHWVQNYEIIGSVPVYYSLGNFVFDQMWSEETKKGMLVKMTFDQQNGETGVTLVKTEEFKTYTPKIGQPVLQEGV